MLRNQESFNFTPMTSGRRQLKKAVQKEEPKHEPIEKAVAKPIEKPKQSNSAEEEAFKPKTNEELNAQDPSRKKRRQATDEELNNPLHGVKLAQILERLVEHYGWEYLGERVKIRCFMYNPTMKSSLGFLRKTQWAREHVEDVYLEMMGKR